MPTTVATLGSPVFGTVATYPASYFVANGLAAVEIYDAADGGRVFSLYAGQYSFDSNVPTAARNKLTTYLRQFPRLRGPGVGLG